jgi:uncharacterized membrane protein
MSDAKRDTPPQRFYHGRVIGLVLAITLFAMVVVDLFFDQRLSWWTLGKTLGSSAVILAYFYLVRFPKLRGR